MKPADRYDLTSMCSDLNRFQSFQKRCSRFHLVRDGRAKTGGHRCLKIFLDFSSAAYACASSASSYKDCHIMLSMHIHLEIMHHTVTRIVRTVLQNKARVLNCLISHRVA